jgi:hypothetical protein
MLIRYVSMSIKRSIDYSERKRYGEKTKGCEKEGREENGKEGSKEKSNQEKVEEEGSICWTGWRTWP